MAVMLCGPPNTQTTRTSRNHKKKRQQPDVSAVLRQLEAGSVDAQQLIKQARVVVYSMCVYIHYVNVAWGCFRGALLTCVRACVCVYVWECVRVRSSSSSRRVRRALMLYGCDGWMGRAVNSTNQQITPTPTPPH